MFNLLSIINYSRSINLSWKIHWLYEPNAIWRQVLSAVFAHSYPTRAKTLSSWGSKGMSTLNEVWKSGVNVARNGIMEHDPSKATTQTQVLFSLTPIHWKNTLVLLPWSLNINIPFPALKKYIGNQLLSSSASATKHSCWYNTLFYAPKINIDLLLPSPPSPLPLKTSISTPLLLKHWLALHLKKHKPSSHKNKINESMRC